MLYSYNAFMHVFILFIYFKLFGFEGRYIFISFAVLAKNCLTFKIYAREESAFLLNLFKS